MTTESTPLVTYAPVEVPGRGWTVVKRTGSKRTGRAEEPTDVSDGLTLHQATAIAVQMTRDLKRHGPEIAVAVMNSRTHFVVARIEGFDRVDVERIAQAAAEEAAAEDARQGVEGDASYSVTLFFDAESMRLDHATRYAEALDPGYRREGCWTIVPGALLLDSGVQG